MPALLSREARTGSTVLVDQGLHTGRHPAASTDYTFVDALNRAQFGIIVTPLDARPTFVNAYAQRLLDSRDGLFLTEDGLHALQVSDTRRLRDLIARGVGRQLSSCAALQLQRGSRLRPLILYIPAHGYARTAPDCVTIYICDPHHEPLVDQSMLCSLFGFTRAEAVLARLLMRGFTIDQAAGMLSVSEHTVRTHVKRMLVKTDTGRQTELVRLLLTCSAQVRLD